MKFCKDESLVSSREKLLRSLPIFFHVQHSLVGQQAEKQIGFKPDSLLISKL